MPLNVNNNYLTDLVASGNDAYNNLYEAVFRGGQFEDLDAALAASVRTKGINIPSYTQGEYQVKYITAAIPMPNAKIEIQRTFSLTIRLDAYWSVYQTLLEQQRVTSNPARSFVATNINRLIEDKKLFDVSVNIVKLESDNGDNPTDRLVNFKNCWIESIEPIRFDYNSNPLEVNCTINFLQMEDWQSGLTGDDIHKGVLI